MGRQQWIAAGAAAALLLFTYVACPVRPPELAGELVSAPTAATGRESLIRQVRDELSPAQIATFSQLETALNALPEGDPGRTPLLKELAGEWYRAGQPALSGTYAEEVAQAENTATAWGIAGTTYSLCLQREGADERTRQFCADGAERAYQSAISLDPDAAEYRINLAVTYTDFPPRDNPMKGVLQLRELVERYPDNPRVYLTLAQLAIKTNQFERAAERLEQAVALAPELPEAVCNLARVYDTLKRQEAAAALQARCAQLTR